MAGYAVFDLLQVTDSAKMDEYRQKVRATIEKHGGRVVVAGGKFEVVEGSAKPTFPVILEFPSLEAAERWYDSEEYRPLKALRLAAGAPLCLSAAAEAGSSCRRAATA
jgi:uncharacterized protein (DUF1330 family)